MKKDQMHILIDSPSTNIPKGIPNAIALNNHEVLDFACGAIELATYNRLQLH